MFSWLAGSQIKEAVWYQELNAAFLKTPGLIK